MRLGIPQSREHFLHSLQLNKCTKKSPEIYIKKKRLICETPGFESHPIFSSPNHLKPYQCELDLSG